MDRRQRKSREAILGAFTNLLGEKNFNQITVEEIISRADVGRATFYAHFETKDFLLKELCRELFCHIFDSVSGEHGHHHIFSCDAPDSIFIHLFQHLKHNDNQITQLLCSQNNQLFMSYFKQELLSLFENQFSVFYPTEPKIEKSFLVNHLASTFVETVSWWSKNGMLLSVEEINKYFIFAVKGE
ncbi:MAG: TetR/AcrR family transcriptional regulator [Clostridia bacterium]|nr:TetR/AcrR family transcriptional regulator [Clostridia bacterium]